jgi:hypothetical protein
MKHKWHKEIKAWADGAEIEYRNNGFENWNLVESKSPEWLFDNYRIKPSVKEPSYLYVYLNTLGQTTLLHGKAVGENNWTFIGKIKLEEE